MNKKILGLFFCLSMLAPALYAHDMWSGNKKVLSVQVTSNGGFLLNVDSEINADCMHGGTSVLHFSPYENEVTEAGAKSLLSTALIAFSTGHNVNILYSNDTIFCWGKSLLISR